MKTVLKAFSALVVLMSAASLCAADPATRGKELFNDKKLGSNGKSCATCHPDVSKLKQAAAYEDDELVEIINKCIKEALKGKPLPADSQEMKAMIAYHRTFDKP